MGGSPALSVSPVRKIFWLAWPLLTLTALLLIGARSLALLGYEGQFVNMIRPTAGIALVDGVQLGQTFVAPRAGLERIEVLMYGYHRHNTQPVTFHLRKDDAEQDEVSFTFNAGEVRGWRWRSFRFDPLADSAGQTYYFFFDSPTSTPDDALTMGGVEGDLYPNGTALINGHPAFADAAFKSFYADVSLTDKLSALVARVTQSKPSIWGDVRFYVLLTSLYLLLVIRLGWCIYRMRSASGGTSEAVDA
jgi:hypothetical protein